MFRRKTPTKPTPGTKSTISETRLQRELKDLQECADSGVSAAPVDEQMSTHWRGKILGPDDTVYQGGIFYVDIVLTESYPFTPPKMRFETKVWHPNVSSQTGAICLDILKDQWSPALTLRTALQSLQALLSAPVPDDPQDAVVARMYLDERALFDKTAKEWTARYATESGVDEGTVAELVEMGFEEKAIRQALTNCEGDKERALEALLGGAQ